MEKDLPSGWSQARVEELADLIRGITYKKEQARSTFEQGYKPILRANNINGVLNFESLVYVPEELINEKQYIRKDDIVFAMSSGSKHLVGKSARAVTNFNGSYGAFCGLVRPSDKICKPFLFYAFQERKFRQLINQVSKGSNINNLKREHILDFVVSFPPINEQERIVAKIEELFSELDSGIASLKTAREQLKVYRQAVLKHAFEGKLTAQWRKDNPDKLETPEQLLTRIQQERETRYQQQLNDWKLAVKDWEVQGKEGKRPSKPKKLAVLKDISKSELSELASLPVGWSYVRLGNLIDEPTYGTSAKCEYDSGNTGVLRIPNIKNNAIDDGDLKFASFDEGEIKHFALEEGDLLTIRSNGSISLVGTCALIKEKDTRHIFAGYLIRLRPNQSSIHPSFLLAVLTSHLLRRQIETAAKSTSGVNNINSGELQNLIIPIPTIQEQHELLKHLDTSTPSINVTELEIERQLLKAETLRQSILKKAFSGQLVPQDPNDEPASELLARIQAEKANSIKKKSAVKNGRKTTAKEPA